MPAGPQVVGPPGLQARPLGDGTSIGTVRVLAFPPLRPAGRRVLPRLLPPVDRHVEQSVAVAHRLDTAPRRPVSLEDTGAVSQVAHDVHHAHPASNQESVERGLGRVPRHLPAHEVAVPDALFVRALAERGVGDVTGMQEGQLADLRCIEPMALVSYILDDHSSILQTKLGHREGYEARRVGVETMPLDEHIESRQGERQACLKIRPAPMQHLFEMADQRQHREHGLHQHAVLPLTALTPFEVRGIVLGGMEGRITQDNHLVFKLANQPLKGVIRDIGRGAGPPHDQPPLIEEQTEFASNNPAVIGEAFAADLLGAAALAHGVDQLDTVGVDDAEHGRSGQEDLRPVLMRLEETKEPGSLGEVGKQRPIVARQPAIEGPVAPTFEGMQQPQGDHLTGPEVGLGMFGDGAHLLIDLIEQRCDQLHRGHAALLSGERCPQASVEELSADCKPKNMF